MSKLPSKQNWYVACQTKELRENEIIHRKILNKNIALYRVDGQVSAVADKCPHKHLPLNIGMIRDGELTCRHHGWQFNREGELTKIPCHGENDRILKCRVSTS